MAGGTFSSTVRAQMLQHYASGIFLAPWSQSCDASMGVLTYPLADGAVNDLLPVYGPSGLQVVEALALVSTAPVDVRLGDPALNAAFPLQANAPLLLMGVAFASIRLSNSSGGPAMITLLCAGGT